MWRFASEKCETVKTKKNLRIKSLKNSLPVNFIRQGAWYVAAVHVELLDGEEEVGRTDEQVRDSDEHAATADPSGSIPL